MLLVRVANRAGSGRRLDNEQSPPLAIRFRRKPRLLHQYRLRMTATLHPTDLYTVTMSYSKHIHGNNGAQEP